MILDWVSPSLPPYYLRPITIHSQVVHQHSTHLADLYHHGDMNITVMMAMIMMVMMVLMINGHDDNGLVG